MMYFRSLIKLAPSQSPWISIENLISKGVSSNAIRPFKEIPGPRGLPLIGNTYRFLPIIGQFDKNNVDNLLNQLHKYGDIVKLDGIPFKKPLVFLFTATLAKEMYKKEGMWPRREAIDCMQYYFDVKKKYGLSVLQGKDWREFRTKVNQSVAKFSDVHLFNEQIETVTNDFIFKMRLLRDPVSLEMPANFINELNKWALETICLITFNCRLGCLEGNLGSDGEVQKLIDSTGKMFELMFDLENSFLWKLFGKTPKLNQLFQAMDTVVGIAEKYINCTVEQLRTKSNTSDLSMLEKLLLRTDEKTAVIMAQDLIAGGVDTVSNTVGKALYAVAAHPEVQKKLFLELQTVLPCVDSQFTKETMEKVPYLKAVLKETMRLFPPLPGNTRTTCGETILEKFIIPKGVNVFMAHSVMCKKPEYFQEPHCFDPERWLREHSKIITSLHDEATYAFRPFGHGLRSCVAKHLATNEMLIFIGKVIRAFELEWNHGPLELQYHLMNKVKSPLKIKVTDRKI